MSSLLRQFTLVALFGAVSPLPITVAVTLAHFEGWRVIGRIAQIVEAEVSSVQEWVALAVLLIVLQLGVIVPIIVCS